MHLPLLAVAVASSAEPMAVAQEPGSAFAVGVEAFGEFFPASSEKVPRGGDPPQQSVLTGLRLAFGVRFNDRFRGFAILEVGYAAAGRQAGNGQDFAGGESLGFGAALGWQWAFEL